MNPLSRKAVVGYLAATFVAGTLAGGFATRAFFPKTPQRPNREGGGMGKRMLATFTKELKLSTNQVELCRPIMEAADRDMSETHRENGRRMREAFDRCNAHLLPLLNSDQKILLEDYKKRFADRRREHPPGGLKPGGEPPAPSKP